MSSLVDSILFDSVFDGLPETLEWLARRRAKAGGARERGGDGEWGSVPADILETPKSYSFFLDVPGLSKSDAQVTLEDGNMLVVKSSNAKRKRDEAEEEGCRYLRLERKAPPKFVRKFRLPDNVNTSAITARCENGVLTVVVEKLPPPPEAKPNTVEMKIA